MLLKEVYFFRNEKGINFTMTKSSNLLIKIVKVACFSTVTPSPETTILVNSCSVITSKSNVFDFHIFLCEFLNQFWSLKTHIFLVAMA